MCGIAGFWARSPLDSNPAELLRRMGAALTHRGPDDDGTWLDPTTGVGLAHRRLAILDLSGAARQPMESRSGRFVIVLNGEIYNHSALREQLAAAGSRFRSRSDTEVLLEAVERYGPTGGVRRCTGMFALALFDRQERVLYLARDRMGEKPLYYGWVNGALVFASELKALRPVPGWPPPIDPAAVSRLVRHNYVPGPGSIYQAIRKVAPGTIVSLEIGRGAATVREEAYWRLRDAVAEGARRPLRCSREEAEEQVTGLLGAVVRDQMIADVPVGAFLSGGVDSSLIVSLMAAGGAGPPRSFTIGFADSRFDERPFAAALAGRFGGTHVAEEATEADAMAIVPELGRIYDEPFADSSQIPTVLLARLARRSVTVALTGDGADELFGGYARYRLLGRIAAWRSITPPAGRRVAAGALRMAARSGRWLGPAAVGPVGRRLGKLASVLAAPTSEALYEELVSHWLPEATMPDPAGDASLRAAADDGWPAGLRPVEGAMLADQLAYLPDDLLVKVDRAAMSVGLETRSPFLDHRVVELAWRLPLDHRISGRRGKLLLKDALRRQVPAAMVDRPKRGFGVPLAEWLRSGLRDWADDLLAVDALGRDGWFRADGVRRRWEEHRRGEADWSAPLWSILMFQAWRHRG